jgi:hypothetical protein
VRRAVPRKPMPKKPPKVEVPATTYRRRPKHPRPAAEASDPEP